MSDVVKRLAANDGGDFKIGDGRIRATFFVQTDAAKTALTVLSVTGVPAEGAEDTTNAGYFAKSRSAKSLGNGYEWEVAVEYEAADNGTLKPQESKRMYGSRYPWGEPWEFNLDFFEAQSIPTSMTTVNVSSHATGAAVDPQINTAGDAWGSPMVEPIYCPVIQLQKNIVGAGNPATAIVAEAMGLHGSVNTAAITVAGFSIPVRAGWMRRYQPERRYYIPETGGSAVGFWRYYIDIVVFPDPYRTYIAQVQLGYKQLVATVPTAILYNGVAPRNPAKLDAAGALTDTAYYRYFTRSKETSWASAGLPNSV